MNPYVQPLGLRACKVGLSRFVHELASARLSRYANPHGRRLLASRDASSALVDSRVPCYFDLQLRATQ